MKSATPLTHTVVLSQRALSTALVFVMLLSVAMVSLISSFILSRPGTAHAADNFCLPLTGDTAPVTFPEEKFIAGAATVTRVMSNTGAMHFGPWAEGRPTLSPYGIKKIVSYEKGPKNPTITYDPPQKAIYYPPADQLACAELVNGVVYLRGWVWNDNVGWISMYCPGDGNTNKGVQCGVVKYGVQLDPKTGLFSGYAWSNVGWIRMSCLPTPGFKDINYCDTSNHRVQITNLADGLVKPVVPFIDVTDPAGLSKDNFTAWAWTTAAQWMSFAGLRVPLDKLVDKKCEKGKTACGEDDKLVPSGDDDPDDPAAPAAAKGITLDTAEGDFPVTVADPLYLDGALKAGSGTSALNPVSQASVRNLIYRNVVKWKTSASTACGNSDGDFLLQYTTKDRVFYCKGDLYLKAGAKWTGSKTIIVDGGNVIIEDSLFSDKGQLGLIVLRNKFTNKKQGNIYITPSVRDMRVQMYADGSIYPAVTGKDGKVLTDSNGVPTINDASYAISDSGTLFGQLYIQGMMVSDNSQGLEGDDTSGDAKGASQLRSLGYLRSMPADPDPDTETVIAGKKKKAPLSWDGYFTYVDEGAKSGGKIVVKKKCEVVDTSKNKSTDDNSDGTGTGKKPQVGNEKKDICKDENKSTDDNSDGTGTGKKPKPEKQITLKGDLKKEPTIRKSSRAALKVGDEKLLSDNAVYIQWEPPAPDLPGFEATLGGNYRQTGG